MMNRIATNRWSWVLMAASWLGWWAGAWHHHGEWSATLMPHAAVVAHQWDNDGRLPLPDDERHCAICASSAHRNAIFSFSGSAVPSVAPVGSTPPEEPVSPLLGSRVSADQRGPPAA